MWYQGLGPDFPLPPPSKANTLRRDRNEGGKKRREGWTEVQNEQQRKRDEKDRKTDECSEPPAGCWYFKTKCLTRLAGIHWSVLCRVNLNLGEREGDEKKTGGEMRLASPLTSLKNTTPYLWYLKIWFCTIMENLSTVIHLHAFNL